MAPSVPRLSVELVPSACWFSNLRDPRVLSPQSWDALRRLTYQAAGYRCEVCGGRGPKHPVEAHEIWEYNDALRIQSLVRTVALCPDCHACKHPGLAETRGQLPHVISHLAHINGWTELQAKDYLAGAFQQWRGRSRYDDWLLDISWIQSQGIEPVKTCFGPEDRLETHQPGRQHL